MSADWDPGHRGLGDVDRDVDEERRGERDRGPRRGSRGGGSSGDGQDAPDAGRIAWLIVGGLAIAGGTALGWDADALSVVVTPPSAIRAALIGLAVAVAMVLLIGALERLGAADDEADGLATGRRGGRGADGRDIGRMIRGVRLVFLAVAALAAASGWLLGHPLPLVVALVIAGVDVLETSFLLLVVGLRGQR